MECYQAVLDRKSATHKWEGSQIGFVPLRSVYIASTLANWKRVKELIKILKSHDIAITFDWTEYGEAIFSGKQTDYDAENLRYKAENELMGVLKAEHLFIVLPGGKGTHFEAGVFYQKWMTSIPDDTDIRAMPPKITLLDEERAAVPTSFHYMHGIYRATDQTDAINHITRRLSQAVGDFKQIDLRSDYE